MYDRKNNFVEKAKFFSKAFQENLAIEQEKQRLDIETKLVQNAPLALIAKGGQLYATIWLSVYLLSLVFIFFQLDSIVVEVEKHGIDVSGTVETAYTWLENNLYLPYIKEIVSFSRQNPSASVFFSSLVLADLGTI